MRPQLRDVCWFSAAALLVAAPDAARAYCRTTTARNVPPGACATTGIPLRWERQCISFSVGSDDAAVRDAVDRSFATWSDVECGGRPVGIALQQTEETARCTQPQYNADAPNMNAILFLEDWEAQELPFDAFAVTLVWNVEATGEIVDTDMLLNATIGNLTVCGDACADPSGDIDIQSVVTHEAGHFLGLAHSDVEGATLSSLATRGRTEFRDLADDDRAGVCAIYGDLGPASCSVGDFVPQHGFSADCWEPEAPDGGSLVDGGRQPGPGSSSSDGGEPRASAGSCSVGVMRPARSASFAAWIAALALAGGLQRTHRRRRA